MEPLCLNIVRFVHFPSAILAWLHEQKSHKILSVIGGGETNLGMEWSGRRGGIEERRREWREERIREERRG